MSEIHVNSYCLQVPGTFNDLTRRQLLQIMPIMHQKTTQVDAIARYTLILLDIPHNLRMTYYWLFKISEDDKLDAAQFCEFLFKSAVLTINKLKKVQIYRPFQRSITLYGPLDKLRNIGFLEFIRADTYFLAHSRAHQAGNIAEEMDKLNLLVAVLYRPKRKAIDPETFNGDHRMVFNDAQIEHRIDLVKRLSLAEKQCIALFYASSRMELIKSYTYLFNNEEGNSGGGGWADAIYAIAGNALKMKAVGREDAALILYDLNRKIKEQKEQEK